MASIVDAHIEELERIFKDYSSHSSSGAAMKWPDLMALLADGQVLQEGKLPPSDALRVFVSCQLFTVDEQTTDQHKRLSLIDFVEALARIAAHPCMSPTTTDVQHHKHANSPVPMEGADSDNSSVGSRASHTSSSTSPTKMSMVCGSLHSSSPIAISPSENVSTGRGQRYKNRRRGGEGGGAGGGGGRRRKNIMTKPGNAPQRLLCDRLDGLVKDLVDRLYYEDSVTGRLTLRVPVSKRRSMAATKLSKAALRIKTMTQMRRWLPSCGSTGGGGGASGLAALVAAAASPGTSTPTTAAARAAGDDDDDDDDGDDATPTIRGKSAFATALIAAARKQEEQL